MPCCVLKTCSSHTRISKKSQGVTFHRFLPSAHENREKWIKFVQRNRRDETWFPTEYSYICSLHFKEEDKYQTKSGRVYLTKSAVPYDNNEPTTSMVEGRVSASTSQQPDLDLLDPDEQSDSSLISDPEETGSAPAPREHNDGQQILSADFLCKACLKNFKSFRYRCLVCPDYEMCGDCARWGGYHDDHYVLRVPMQRPTVEVDKVESAVRRALSSFPVWTKAFKSTADLKVGIKKRLKKSGTKPDKTRNSGDARTDTENDSQDTEDEPSDVETNPEITLQEPETIEPEEAGSDDEPAVKLELVIKEEVDPLEEETATDSAFLENMYEFQTTGSQDVPSTQLVPPTSKGVPPSCLIPPSEDVPSSNIAQASYLVPLIQGVPLSQSDPPSKRRRDDEHCSTTTTHSHKTARVKEEPTELCTETTSSSSVATSSTSGSKVDVFVLKKRTRPVEENDD